MTETLELTEAMAQQAELNKAREALADEYRASYDRALIAFCKGRFGEAGGICGDILAELQAPEPHAMLGRIAAKKKNHKASVEALTRAVAMAPHHIEVGEWYLLLSQEHLEANNDEDGINMAILATCWLPESPEPYISLARGYSRTKRGPDADESIKLALLKAMSLDKEHAMSHFWLGALLLSQGEFKSGWREWEWRLKTDFVMSGLPKMKSAIWTGWPVKDGRILVVHEGGSGDFFMLARLLPKVRELCQEVVLLCPENIAPLLDGIYEGVSVVTNLGKAPPHAGHVALMSLPSILDLDERSISEVPVTQLRYDERLDMEAKAYLRPYRGKRVGFCWGCSQKHQTYGLRSIALSVAAPLRKVPGITLFNLQIPVPDSDREEFTDWASSGDILLPPVKDWAETAALIRNLDVVVTVDTGVAHLAGSLGVRTYVLLPESPEWRWLRYRIDSPWYPSVGLVRQNEKGWSDVISRVCHLLCQPWKPQVVTEDSP